MFHDLSHLAPIKKPGGIAESVESALRPTAKFTANQRDFRWEKPPETESNVQNNASDFFCIPSPSASWWPAAIDYQVAVPLPSVEELHTCLDVHWFPQQPAFTWRISNSFRWFAENLPTKTCQSQCPGPRSDVSSASAHRPAWPSKRWDDSSPAIVFFRCWRNRAISFPAKIWFW